MIIPLIVFFGFIGLALVTLLVTNKIASKYLNGDYLMVDEEEGTDDMPEFDLTAHGKVKSRDKEAERKQKEEEKQDMKAAAVTFQDVVTIETSDAEGSEAIKARASEADIELSEMKRTGKQPPAEMVCETQEAGTSGTKDDDMVDVAPSKDRNTFVPIALESSLSYAKLTLTAEFNVTTKTITGVIETLEGLLCDEKSYPHDVHFHVKIVPDLKHRKKTAWSALENTSNNNVLNIDFSIGPLPTDKLHPDSRVCFRLYGKKRSCVSKSKCFGECFVHLNSIIESECPVKVAQLLLPKASSSAIKDTSVVNSSLMLSSDSETEETHFEA